MFIVHIHWSYLRFGFILFLTFTFFNTIWYFALYFRVSDAIAFCYFDKSITQSKWIIQLKSIVEILSRNILRNDQGAKCFCNCQFDSFCSTVFLHNRKHTYHLFQAVIHYQNLVEVANLVMENSVFLKLTNTFFHLSSDENFQAKGLFALHAFSVHYQQFTSINMLLN